MFSTTTSRRSLARASCAAAVATLFAQQPPQQPTFTATAPLVLVPVTVQDRAGHPIDGLEREQFELLDNGKPRRFETEERVQPIALLILIQTSLNAAPALTRITRIGGMIEPLIIGKRGQAAVMTFANESKLVQKFTGDPFRIANSINVIRPQGGLRRQIDAMSEAVAMLREMRDYRRVILLISEGRDSGSKRSLDEVATEAQRDNVSIYALTFSPALGALTAKPGEAAPTGGMNLLALFSLIKQQGERSSADVFTQFTGGRRWGFLKQETLDEAVTAIGEELHSQYLLTFEPAPEAGGQYHRLEVRVKGQAEAVVRARPGYWLGAP